MLVLSSALAVDVVDPCFEVVVRALTAEEMEGRGAFTAGIERAASWIEGRMASAGLVPRDAEGQRFEVVQLGLGATFVGRVPEATQAFAMGGFRTGGLRR